MLKILVSGANGQITQSLKFLENKSTEIVCVGRPELDLCIGETIGDAIRKYQPDIVVNAAAYTAVDNAEDEVDLAFATNCSGAGLMAKECAKAGIAIIHISTDYVFDGSNNDPYLEDAKTAPATQYGKSKLCGEREVQAANPRHIILRTAWVYSSHGANFLKTMIRLSAERDEINVVNDQYGTPTFAGDIAATIIEIAKKVANNPADSPLWGIYHFTNQGKASWCDFATEIMRLRSELNLSNAQILPVPSSMYPTRAMRPNSSLLNCKKIEAQFGIKPKCWKTILTELMVKGGMNYQE